MIATLFGIHKVRQERGKVSMQRLTSALPLPLLTFWWLYPFCNQRLLLLSLWHRCNGKSRRRCHCRQLWGVSPVKRPHNGPSVGLTQAEIAARISTAALEGWLGTWVLCGILQVMLASVAAGKTLQQRRSLQNNANMKCIRKDVAQQRGYEVFRNNDRQSVSEDQNI